MGVVIISYEKSVQLAKELARLVSLQGGRAYYVGGFVRDRLMGKENKDIDIEVHGITPDVLEKILDNLGRRIQTGKSFGVYGLCGHSIDIAMPRRETLKGKGHRDFKIDIEPFIGTEKAAMRRDFNVNAIMQDVLTGRIIDHFGGQKDLTLGVLRHIDDTTFPEDPLRVLRGAQFAARFNFNIAPETVELCKKIDLSFLSPERVFEELKKALLKSQTPSLFFENLRTMNQLSVWFGELEKLIGINQHTEYHQEGDVWTHTMMVLDEAAKRRKDAQQPLYFMLSALVHDFGKITSTEFINGQYHAYLHEQKGLPLVEAFLQKITREKALYSYVLNMTMLHMKPNVLARDNASLKATNKMFDSAVSGEDLILLSACDSGGKIPKANFSETENFLRERLSIYKEYMSRPYVTGQDLIKMGIEPGENFSELLSYSHKLRLAGILKKDALTQVKAYAKEKGC